MVALITFLRHLPAWSLWRLTELCGLSRTLYPAGTGHMLRPALRVTCYSWETNTCSTMTISTSSEQVGEAYPSCTTINTRWPKLACNGNIAQACPLRDLCTNTHTHKMVSSHYPWFWQTVQLKRTLESPQMNHPKSMTRVKAEASSLSFPSLLLSANTDTGAPAVCTG